MLKFGLYKSYEISWGGTMLIHHNLQIITQDNFIYLSKEAIYYPIFANIEPEWFPNCSTQINDLAVEIFNRDLKIYDAAARRRAFKTKNIFIQGV